MPNAPWFVVQVQGFRGPAVLQAQQKPFAHGGKEVAGPFPTKADAEHAAAQILKKAGDHFPGSGIIHDFTSGLSGIERVGAVLEAGYKAVTDWHFWVSLGWTLLGLFLMGIGIYLWIRTSGAYKSVEAEITGAVGKVA